MVCISLLTPSINMRNEPSEEEDSHVTHSHPCCVFQGGNVCWFGHHADCITLSYTMPCEQWPFSHESQHSELTPWLCWAFGWSLHQTPQLIYLFDFPGSMQLLSSAPPMCICGIATHKYSLPSSWPWFWMMASAQTCISSKCTHTHARTHAHTHTPDGKL